MSLENAVELVLFAFQQGHPGDIFVQKAPAASIGQLASVLQRILQSSSPIGYIGKRNGDKLHETLVTKEEMANAEDLGNYFRIRADAGDLSYMKDANTQPIQVNDKEAYTSHNTHRLSDVALKEILLKIDFIKNPSA